MRQEIRVSILEFDEGGHTLWVHGPKGGTVLRIKCSGTIRVNPECDNICAHSDIMVEGDIEVCVPTRRRTSKP